MNEIFPHPGNLEKIEDYFDNGIDCTHDGIWCVGRSPNYNMVADYGLLIVQDLHIVTGNAEQRCARLVLCGYSPFAHEVVFQA